MTAPIIEFDEARHRYRVNGESVPSVTQILGVIDKSGPLTWWAQGVGVQGVCQLRRMGVEIPWDDNEGIVKLLTEHKLTTNHSKQRAGTRGTSLHTALGGWMVDRTPPNPADFPAEDRGYVQALARALLHLQPTVIDSETMVASVKHGFAGRYDLRAQIVDARVVLIDLKTGKKVYPEQHFPQLEAYEGARLEMGQPATDARMVLRLAADGEYEIAESYATFDDFLAIKQAFDSLQRIKGARPRKRRRLKEAA